MPFTFERLDIPALIFVRSRLFSDERGAFLETYRESEFAEGGITERFVQDNSSISARAVVRGLHMQVAPSQQGKLVQVTSGAVFDVAVDLRRGSPSFGRWVGVILSATEHSALFIPTGFAHGFQALEDDTRVSYKCTAEYDPATERGIRFDDPELAIAWPLPSPIVSTKDLGLPSFAAFRAGDPTGRREKSERRPENPRRPDVPEMEKGR
ncbi:MAG: dTDP-4-dehydrorhamnose 3,5-epimerase [Spirochaetaceae bacterium]